MVILLVCGIGAPVPQIVRCDNCELAVSCGLTPILKAKCQHGSKSKYCWSLRRKAVDKLLDVLLRRELKGEVTSLLGKIRERFRSCRRKDQSYRNYRAHRLFRFQ